MTDITRKLADALRGVIRVADRATVEFDAARAALAALDAEAHCDRSCTWLDHAPDCQIGGSAQAGPISDDEIERRLQAAGGRWNGDYWIIEDADLHPFVRAMMVAYASEDQYTTTTRAPAGSAASTCSETTSDSSTVSAASRSVIASSASMMEPAKTSMCSSDLSMVSPGGVQAILPQAAQPAAAVQPLTLETAPLGTKAPAHGGGHWERVRHGWKWCTGSTFPRPGGDWTGELIAPSEHPAQGDKA